MWSRVEGVAQQAVARSQAAAGGEGRGGMERKETNQVYSQRNLILISPKQNHIKTVASGWAKTVCYPT